jgi:hypothetical protein
MRNAARDISIIILYQRFFEFFLGFFEVLTRVLIRVFAFSKGCFMMETGGNYKYFFWNLAVMQRNLALMQWSLAVI